MLTLSVWLRYLELCGETAPFPSRGYPADYIRATAAKLKDAHGAALRRAAADIATGLASDELLPDDVSDAQKEEIKARQETYLDALIARAKKLLGADYAAVQKLAVEDQLADIRTTLETFGVRFDRWYSEQRDLVESGLAPKRARRADRLGPYLRKGRRAVVSHHRGGRRQGPRAGARQRHADLLRQRPGLSRRQAVAWLPLLLDVWGADHHGLLVRMRAAIEALTGRNDALRIPLIQFVTLSSGRMGKRSGNFVTLKDLIAEAGRDETRFFFLMRSHDQHLEFDIELARSKTNENPVYYVQYACARIASVFRQAAERGLVYDETRGRGRTCAPDRTPGKASADRARPLSRNRAGGGPAL